MVTRTMQKHIYDVAKGFPVITITGPRQSGKTTLAKMSFPDYKYFDLEDPDIRQVMKENPKALLSNPTGKYIIDEFQLVPELLSQVKVMVDAAQIESQFILTGSNQFSMMKGLSQSLAGRTAIFNLLPFSWLEIYNPNQPDDGKPISPSLDEAMYKGFYPRLIDKKMNPAMYYTSYISTYLERDIRLLSNVQDLGLFHRFLALCAGRTGSILNKAALANETGIDVKTVNNWLSLLQTSFIIYLLQPWHNNLNKRLIKSPKLYFYDTGLVSRLLRIRDAGDMATHPLRGQIFETFVISEYIKSFYNKGLEAPIYYYRENNGTEIDLIIQNGAKLLPIEIKSAQSVNSAFYKNILAFRKALGKEMDAVLVYGGELEWVHNNILNKPYNSIG